MIKKHLFAVLFIFLATCLIFFKIFLKGFYPVPGDLLVSFYFPWYSGGWEGYDPWTTRKEMLGADSIRQIYPWKEFAAQEFKAGRFPNWNPYTFSGQPLSANFQSSVYYPFNIFYFLTDARVAWILLIVIQPLLGGIFMYLCVRSFGRLPTSSLFAAVAFMFSSYMITWLENGNIAHSYIWLPFAFWAINLFFENLKFRYILILTLALALSILGGHPQTAIYIYIISSIFWIYKLFEQKTNVFKKILPFLFSIAASVFISAIQIIPTYQFYKISPVSLPFSREVFDRSILPYKNLISFFASDFFGHPANNNFWSQSYGDFTPYFGVIPLLFSFWAILRFWKVRFVKFAVLFAAIFILASVHSPITYLIRTLQIPLLDSTTPSRFISISIFLLIILSALGFEDFLKSFTSRKLPQGFVKFLAPFAVIYAIFWLFAVFGSHFLEPRETWQINLAVTRRNLILPTAMFLSIPVITTMIRIIVVRVNLQKSLAQTLLVISLFTVVLVGGVYYSNKFLPVAPKKFIFPNHPVFDWLRNNAGINRFYGGGTAHIDYNFPVHYEVYGAEGYDTTRIERYAELLASGASGQVPESYLRSDGVFPDDLSGRRERLFELLGVRYLLDKEDMPKTGADWHYDRFPNDSIEGILQMDKFQIYERKKVLPRIFLTTQYHAAVNDAEIIQKIYDPNFDLETLILEEEPPIKIEKIDDQIVIPKLIKYDPSEIIINTVFGYNALLFLSDAYEDGWNVYIDGARSRILRTHYALRSVAVPAGDHAITFKYQPKSFAVGAMTTFLSLASIIILSFYFILRKRF